MRARRAPGAARHRRTERLLATTIRTGISERAAVQSATSLDHEVARRRSTATASRPEPLSASALPTVLPDRRRHCCRLPNQIAQARTPAVAKPSEYRKMCASVTVLPQGEAQPAHQIVLRPRRSNKLRLLRLQSARLVKTRRSRAPRRAAHRLSLPAACSTAVYWIVMLQPRWTRKSLPIEMTFRPPRRLVAERHLEHAGQCVHESIVIMLGGLTAACASAVFAPPAGTAADQ